VVPTVGRQKGNKDSYITVNSLVTMNSGPGIRGVDLRLPGTIASPNKGISNSYILTNSHNAIEVKLLERLERKKITTAPPHPTPDPETILQQC
jgi:hypothetical protein